MLCSTLANRVLVPLALSAALASGCTTNFALSDTDLAAVRAAWDAIDEADRATDWDTLEGLLTSDFKHLTPRTAIIRGRGEWRAFVEASAISDVEINYTVDEIGGSGDLAYVIWSYRGTYTEGGARISTPGKGMSLFRRQPDSKWLNSRNAWIEDTPAGDR